MPPPPGQIGLRNNLLLGKRAEKVKNSKESKCYICGQHKESRVLLFLGCKKVQEITQFLIRVLKKADFLKKGCEMSLFFFTSYNINSIENILLAILWNFIYNNKFNDDVLQGLPFVYWLKKMMSQLTAFPPPLSLKAGYMLEVLNSEIWHPSKVIVDM